MYNEQTNETLYTLLHCVSQKNRAFAITSPTVNRF